MTQHRATTEERRRAQLRRQHTRQPYRNPAQGEHRETVDQATAAKLGIIRLSTDHQRGASVWEEEADDQANDEGEEDEEIWPTRLPSSARRYTTLESGPRYQLHQEEVDLPLPRRASAARRPQGTPNRATPPDVVYASPARRTREAPAGDPPWSAQGQVWRPHPLLWVGLALLVMILGWVALSALGSWWSTVQDDWTYGRPRTFQRDCTVGHGTVQHPESHFIATNLDRHIQVIEIPGEDPSKERVYPGPTLLGPGQDLTPVTLSCEDVNHDGRLDLVLHVQGDTIVYLNQPDGTFKAAPQYNQ